MAINLKVAEQVIWGGEGKTSSVCEQFLGLPSNGMVYAGNAAVEGLGHHPLWGFAFCQRLSHETC